MASEASEYIVPQETEKTFQLEGIFKNILNLKESQWDLKEIHYLYNVPWRLAMFYMRSTQRLTVFLECMKTRDKLQEFKIATRQNLKFWDPKIPQPNRKTESIFTDRHVIHVLWTCHMEKEKIENYLDPLGQITVSVDVQMEAVGGVKEKLRDFSDPLLSDMVLEVADGRSFHVSKLFMAAQSGYFRKLVLGEQKLEKNDGFGAKMKIKLEGVNWHELQNYLELIHGESAVDEDSAIGILRVACRFDSPTAIRRCEEFFLEKSIQPIREKLHASILYRMPTLKEYCISQIRTEDEIKETLLKHILAYEPELRQELYRLSLILLGNHRVREER